jgi:hypothetical protein
MATFFRHFKQRFNRWITSIVNKNSDIVSFGNSTDGATIFLSHSSQDIIKVRRIRNELERLGHNPILFNLYFLKDDPRLWEFLELEIKARTFFILCDSPSARASPYVKREIEYIRSLQDKICKVIDLNADWYEQFEQLSDISRGMTLFLSYIMSIQDEALSIKNILVRYGYRVVLRENRRAVNNSYSVESAVGTALKYGYVVCLFSNQEEPDYFGEKQMARSLHPDFLQTLELHYIAEVIKKRPEFSNRLVVGVLGDSKVNSVNIPGFLASIPIRALNLTLKDIESIALRIHKTVQELNLLQNNRFARD